MYGIFTYTYHKNQLNAGKYTIHGSSQIYLSNVLLNDSTLAIQDRFGRIPLYLTTQPPLWGSWSVVEVAMKFAWVI